MPAPSTLALFALAAPALTAIPGPNMIHVATRSMSEGRRSGFASALGLLTGTLLNVAAAAAGLSALIAVQLLNPKVTLFFLAFLPPFVDPARGPVATQVLVLGAILGTLGFALDCGYAIAAGAAAKRLGGFRHGRQVTGAVYVALGAAAALTGGRR